jgi:hypothetical protein
MAGSPVLWVARRPNFISVEAKEPTMSITKRALLASGATLALASSVRAQGPGSAALTGAPGPYQGSNETPDVILDHLSDNEAIHVGPDGKVRRLKMNSTGMAAVRPHGREMATGHAMIYREGGRHYMFDNKKMDDGTMLFDHAGWHS